jgi:hypothetical protein
MKYNYPVAVTVSNLCSTIITNTPLRLIYPRLVDLAKIELRFSVSTERAE